MTPSTMEWPEGLKKLLRWLPAPVFWLGVWQLCAFLVDRSVGGRGNELLLPYPATVLSALVEQGGQLLFWQSILATLLRVVAGLGLGIVLGSALAVLTYFSAWCDRLLSPAIRSSGRPPWPPSSCWSFCGRGGTMSLPSSPP